MSIDENTPDYITILGKTHRNIVDDSIYLEIPAQFANELKIENSRVYISLLYDNEGNRNLLISKFHREIVIN